MAAVHLKLKEEESKIPSAVSGIEMLHFVGSLVFDSEEEHRYIYFVRPLGEIWD